MPPIKKVSSSSLAVLIQKSTAVASLKKARQLHALILTTTASSSYAESPYLNNNLMSMYARCGSLSNAQLVFEGMHQRSLVSYNALIAAYSRDSDYAVLSFDLFTHLGNHGLRPNCSTFISLLQACCSLGNWPAGSVVHSQVLKCGFLNDVRVMTSLLGMYSNCGDLESASKVFECVVGKDVVSWNTMIYGNLKNGKIKEGFLLFGEMLRSGLTPTEFTYTMLLNACSMSDAYSYGKVIHARVIILSVADLPLKNALLDMYSSCGNIRNAYSVFHRINNPDLVSWNSMISGFSEHGEGNETMDLFVQLLGTSHLKPDEYTFRAVISATIAFPAIGYGKPLHAQVLKVGLGRSIFIGTALLSMYFKNGDSESAQEVFNLIEEKDIVLWTELIMGYSRLGDGKTAIMLFSKMMQEGHKTDDFALSAALSACADLAISKLGEMIHSHALKIGLDAEMSVCGCLIDMYAKHGDIQSAWSIFSQVSNPDLKCWNSMLGGYSHHGMVDEAMKLFQQILDHGLEPDEVTYLSLLSACSHSGMVETGRNLWNSMKRNGITPGPKHYSCMVSLLSRAGLLDDAEELITKSTCFDQERLKLWRTLLSSCIEKGNLRIGLGAAEQVLRLDPEDSATHILLSNLYAAVGRWDGVAETRRKIRGLMVDKKPGLSWIESKNDFHVFSSGDQLNSMVDETQLEVHRLQKNMLKPADAFNVRIYSS